MQVLRFGLIGCGQQGRQLAAALTHVDGTRLVACADPDRGSLSLVDVEDVARFTDYRAMLETTSGLDAVIVATPHNFLAEAALAAAQANRHVFCEKPLARCAAQARPVVSAARHAGVNLMVGYIQRFDPLRQRMKDLLDREVFGELACVMAGKGGPPLTDWRQSRDSGGGQLLWVGSHLVDQLHWLLGHRVERVYAEMRRSESSGPDLTTVATLRFAGGLLAHLDCSQAAADLYDHIEVLGSEGRGRSEWRPRYRLVVQSGRIAGYATPRTLARSPESLDRASVAELSEFADSIRESRPPSITGEDALRVLEVLDAIVLSSARGEPVAPERSNDA